MNIVIPIDENKSNVKIAIDSLNCYVCNSGINLLNL